jgi:predicted GTPase
MYHENLVKCDVILWVMAARNRAIALDQIYLEQLKPFWSKMVFAVNQVDLIEPLNWNMRINLPSAEQEANLSAILEDRGSRLSTVVGSRVDVVGYSARTRFNLSELFSAAIGRLSSNRRWLFQSLKAFSYDDFLPLELKAELKNQDALYGAPSEPSRPAPLAGLARLLKPSNWSL